MLQHCWFYQLSTGTTAPLPAVGIAWWFGFGVSGGGGYVPPQPRTEKQEGKKGSGVELEQEKVWIL